MSVGKIDGQVVQNKSPSQRKSAANSLTFQKSGFLDVLSTSVNMTCCCSVAWITSPLCFVRLEPGGWPYQYLWRLTKHARSLRYGYGYRGCDQFLTSKRISYKFPAWFEKSDVLDDFFSVLVIYIYNYKTIIYVYMIYIYAHAIAIWWPPKGVKNSTGWVWKNSLPPWIYPVYLAVKIRWNFQPPKGRKSAKILEKHGKHHQCPKLTNFFSLPLNHVGYQKKWKFDKVVWPRRICWLNLHFLLKSKLLGGFENSWNLSGYPSPITDLHTSVNHNTSKWEHLEAYHASMG